MRNWGQPETSQRDTTHRGVWLCSIGLHCHTGIHTKGGRWHSIMASGPISLDPSSLDWFYTPMGSPQALHLTVTNTTTTLTGIYSRGMSGNEQERLQSFRCPGNRIKNPTNQFQATNRKNSRKHYGWPRHRNARHILGMGSRVGTSCQTERKRGGVGGALEVLAFVCWGKNVENT